MNAGVGIGTLYRHFPTREALLLAVYRNEVQQLVDAAPALLAAEPPLVALRTWLDRLAYYGMAKAGLKDALAESHDRLNAETYGPIVGALAALLHGNEAAGTIRPGVDANDVLLMLGFLWRIDPLRLRRLRSDAPRRACRRAPRRSASTARSSRLSRLVFARLAFFGGFVVIAMPGGPSAGDIVPGADIEVRNHFVGTWAGGFEVAEVDGDRVRVCRRSDGVVLPVSLDRRDVRVLQRHGV